MILKHILQIKFLNKLEIFFHSQMISTIFLFNMNNSIYY